MRINSSKVYLLPLLSEYIEFNPKFISNIRNTYIENNKYSIPTISILQKFNYNDADFPEYEQQFLNSELHLESIDKGENVIYILKFPEEYLKEYEYFKQSIYSKFKEEAKSTILGFWTRMYKNNTTVARHLINIKNVLYKEKALRLKLESELKVRISTDQELGEYVNLEQELLTI